MKRKLFLITLIIASMLLAGCDLRGLHLTSSMKSVVPSVAGLTKEEAEAKISNADLASEVILVGSDKVPANVVVKTEPDAGQTVDPFTVIKIFVSKGSNSSVTVPDVIGKTLEDATAAITSQGLKIGDVRYEDSDREKDTVILSDPLPGTSVLSGSKIGLTLSSGRAKARTLIVTMDVPDGNDEIEFTVYINGKQDGSYTKTVDPSATDTVKFKFRGSSGKKTVKIKANGEAYKSYTLDFDNGTVKEA